MKAIDAKNKKLEKTLSQLGTLTALATEEVDKIHSASQVAKDKLVQIQQEIEQIYTTIEEPLLLIDKDE